MKTYAGFCAAATALAMVLWATPVSAVQQQTTIVDSAEASQDIAVIDAQSHDGVVSGTIINRSSEPVRDVELLIDHVWLWNNERHPGEASPGRTDFVTVRGEIPPGGSRPFTYEGVPLPNRSDGRFETQVQVTQFIQVGTVAADQPAMWR